MVFSLQALKEVFAHQLITAKWVVLAPCRAQLELTPTSQASQPVPAALLGTTAQKGLETSPSSAVLLDSTALMVNSVPKHYQSYVCFFVNSLNNLTQYKLNIASKEDRSILLNHSRCFSVLITPISSMALI